MRKTRYISITQNTLSKEMLVGIQGDFWEEKLVKNKEELKKVLDEYLE
jgi:hypothetical protein